MSEETIPEMRAAIDAKDAKIKDLEGALAAKDQDIRVRDAREAFRTAGYNPKHGDLFARDPEHTGDITAEAVAAYADKWDLAPAQAGSNDTASNQGSDTSDADEGTDALKGMDRSGTRSGEGGGGTPTEQTMTRQEWSELQATDPVAASQALSQGRVIISTTGNLRAGQAPVRGGNPYEPQLADSGA